MKIVMCRCRRNPYPCLVAAPSSIATGNSCSRSTVADRNSIATIKLWCTFTRQLSGKQRPHRFSGISCKVIAFDSTPYLCKMYPRLIQSKSASVSLPPTYNPIQQRRIPGKRCSGRSAALSEKFQSAGVPAYKRAAAKLLVDRFIRNGQSVGIGSGELVNLAVEEIGLRLAAGTLHGISAVPACSTAAHEAAFHGVPVAPVGTTKVDIAFDEVDQLDVACNACVIGTSSEPQQPQLLQAQAMAKQATTFVVLADAEDLVTRLKGCLPVMITAADWEATAEELDDLMLGDAELWRRPAFGVANPRGGDFPYVSSEGANILDIRFNDDAPDFTLFGEADVSYSKIVEEIGGCPGVLAHGLLLGLATAAVIARQGGEAEVVELKN